MGSGRAVGVEVAVGAGSGGGGLRHASASKVASAAVRARIRVGLKGAIATSVVYGNRCDNGLDIPGLLSRTGRGEDALLTRGRHFRRMYRIVENACTLLPFCMHIVEMMMHSRGMSEHEGPDDPSDESPR